MMETQKNEINDEETNKLQLRNKLFYNLEADTLKDGVPEEYLIELFPKKKISNIDKNFAIKSKERILFIKNPLRRKILQIIFEINSHIEFIYESVKELESFKEDSNKISFALKEFKEIETIKKSIDFLKEKNQVLFLDKEHVIITKYIFIAELDDILKKNRSIYNKIVYHLENILSKYSIDFTPKDKKFEEGIDSRDLNLVIIKNINQSFTLDKWMNDTIDKKKIPIPSRLKKRTKMVKLTEIGTEFCNRLFDPNSPYYKQFEIVSLYERILKDFSKYTKELEKSKGILLHDKNITEKLINDLNNNMKKYYGEKIFNDIYNELTTGQKSLSLSTRINKKCKNDDGAQKFAQKLLLNFNTIKILYSLDKRLIQASKEISKIKRALNNHRKVLETRKVELINAINPILIEKIIKLKESYNERKKELEKISQEIEKNKKIYEKLEQQTFRIQDDILKISF